MLWQPSMMLAASPNLSSSRCIGCCSVACRCCDGLDWLVYFYSHPILTVFAEQLRMRTILLSLHTLWQPNVVLVASPNLPSSRRIGCCSVACRCCDGLDRLVYYSYYPIRTVFAGQLRMRTILLSLHTLWQPNVMLVASQNFPHHDAYEVVVSLVGDVMAGTGLFILIRIPYELYLLTCSG